MFTAIKKATENTLMHWLLRKVEVTLKKNISYIPSIVCFIIMLVPWKEDKKKKNASSLGL